MNKLVFERSLYLLAACFLFSCSSKNSSGNGGTTPPPPAPPTVQEWIFENNASWTEEFSTDGAPDAANGVMMLVEMDGAIMNYKIIPMV